MTFVTAQGQALLSNMVVRRANRRAADQPGLTIMNYGQPYTTLGEKIITVVGFLFLSTVVVALMVATHLAGIA